MVNRVYVGNLPYKMNDEELGDVFISIGDVVSSKVIVDTQTGRSKGFGFVDLENAEQVKKAIEAINGQEVDGRALKVAVANPPRARA